jgi:NlpC/P60 family.
MVEKNKFLHASSSKGVMISDLNQPYWQRYYWQARRLSQ